MISSSTEKSLMQQIQGVVGSIVQRKVHLFTMFLFTIGSFFLSQAVLFDAAVPFFLPVWALATMRYPKYMLPVFVGGISGSLFLGVGQSVIFLLQILLFNLVIRQPFPRKSIPLTVAGTVILTQVFW